MAPATKDMSRTLVPRMSVFTEGVLPAARTMIRQNIGKNEKGRKTAGQCPDRQKYGRIIQGTGIWNHAGQPQGGGSVSPASRFSFVNVSALCG
jgi:hypothetical protein